MGMTYTHVIPRLGALVSPNLARPEGVEPSGSIAIPSAQRHRMVISNPMIMKANPTAKFHGPSSAMNGIFWPAR